MKFLCGGCRAKYQIADDKVAGRTMRMRCRRCGSDIIIRGDGVTQDTQTTTSRKRAPLGRSSHRAGSALGADFRRQVKAAPRQSSAPGVPLDQWHVAINDVPVGPIRGDEIARKITRGAVTGESLCWREGFDDWRPLREVPELSALLRRPAPPPTPRPPVGRGIGSRTSSRDRIPAARSPSSPNIAAPPPAPQADRPAARSNVVPIGGRMGAAAAPSVEPVAPPTPQPAPPAAAPSSAGEAAPTISPFLQPGVDTYEPVHVARRGLPPMAWIAIAGAGAFGVVFAIQLSAHLLRTDAPAATPAPVATADPATADPVPAGPAAAPAVLGPSPQPTGELAEPAREADRPGAAPRSGGRSARRDRRAESTAAAAASPGAPGANRGAAALSGQGAPTEASRARAPRGPRLSAEEQALLDRMGGSGSMPGKLRVTKRNRSDTPRVRGESLNAQQLRSVVNRNSRMLRRCYETSIRGRADAPSARLDVLITVGTTGSVSRVSARGTTLGTLQRCVESAVRRWRFPAATATTETSFPVVFQPGA